MIRIEPSASQPLVPINTSTVQKTDRGTPSARTSMGSDTVTATAARTSPEYGQLQIINDQQNKVAAQVRQDGQQLGQAGKLLGQMKHQLYQITKIYPPYPLDEPQRVKFLRSFMGLRHQIDSLTIPPPNKWEGQNMGVAADQAAHDTPRQAGEQMPVAPSGTFAIPALSDHASDAEVRAAVDRITTAQSDIEVRQAQLAKQAIGINQKQGADAKVAEFGQRVHDKWTFALPGDSTAAEKKSSEVRQEVAASGGMTFTTTQAPLIALAG